MLQRCKVKKIRVCGKNSVSLGKCSRFKTIKEQFKHEKDFKGLFTYSNNTLFLNLRLQRSHNEATTKPQFDCICIRDVNDSVT